MRPSVSESAQCRSSSSKIQPSALARRRSSCQIEANRSSCDWGSTLSSRDRATSGRSVAESAAEPPKSSVKFSGSSLLVRRRRALTKGANGRVSSGVQFPTKVESPASRAMLNASRLS
jgi:hypothetical protein